VKEGLIKLNKGNFKQFYQTFFNFIRFQRLRRIPKAAQFDIASRVLVESLYDIFMKHGIDFLIQYLKVALYVMYNYLGGTRMRDTSELKFLIPLSRGLPTIIPPFFRTQIRRNNVAIIHIIGTIFYSYKGLKGSNTVLVGSIPESIVARPWEAPGDKMAEWLVYLRDSFISKYPFDITKFTGNYPSPIMSAGPNGSVSSLHLEHDYIALKQHGLWTTVSDYAYETQNTTDWSGYFGLRDQAKIPFPMTSNPSDFNDWWKAHLIELSRDSPNSIDQKKERQLFSDMLAGTQIGKLAIKNEAAGKVRIFAMLDSHSQSMLKPLHDMIFSFLKTLRSDATFDQEGVLAEFMKENKGKRFWSFDLKSATDFIPYQLYQPILSYLIGDEASTLWLQLFQRPFLMPKVFWPNEFSPYWVKYTRGQPMGAYSSWALLALVHHTIVGVAYYRISSDRRLPFGQYLVLGDDITISNPELAQSYREVCADFGIPIGIAKSYVNSSVCNFASQVVASSGENLSPISLKEILQSKTLPSRLELARRFQRRGYFKDGKMNLFRSIYAPESWLVETKFLSKGLLSSFGMRVAGALVRPNGGTSTSAVGLLKELFPDQPMLTRPFESFDLPINENIIKLGWPLRDEAALPRDIRIIAKLVTVLNKQIETFLSAQEHSLKTLLASFYKAGGLRSIKLPDGTLRYIQPEISQKTIKNVRILFNLWEEPLAKAKARYSIIVEGIAPRVGIPPLSLHDQPKNFVVTEQAQPELPPVFQPPTAGMYPEPHVTGYLNPNRVSRFVQITALIDQINRWHALKKDFINLGYEAGEYKGFEKYLLDLVQLVSDLNPTFNPLVYSSWVSFAKSLRVTPNWMIGDSRLLRDMRRISDALGYSSKSLVSFRLNPKPGPPRKKTKRR